jgi:hypothetical protein
MKNFLLTFSIFLLAFTLSAQVINEIDYDQPSTDDAEFIEFVMPLTVTLSDYRVTLYRANGTSYRTAFTLDNSSVICTAGVGLQYCVWDPSGNNNIQNGAGVGVSFYQISTSTLIEVLSYGGTFTGTEGDANGTMSTDIGVLDNSTLDMSVQRNEGLSTWFGPSAISPGAANNNPLPVTLTSFEAKPTQEKSITLTWQTASEENNDYFSIEHSLDGTSFREIVTQAGYGTTTIVQDYSFLHQNVENGLHYYRLKQVDFDGKYEYSNIVTARVSHSNDDIFLTPNPTSNVILIQTKTPFERDADFQILNMQGQVVLSSVLQEGTANLEVNISDFPVGIYYLQLFVDNDVMMKKIIKQ